MSKLLKTDVPHLSKDTVSGALINTDMNAYKAALARKQAIAKTSSRLDALELQVTSLHSTMKQTSQNVNEIKNLLQKLTGA